MPTSVYDIARAAGVSRTTVLRALWNRDRIDPATKARVLKIAAELNYRPNMLARSLVTGKSRFVGVLATVRSRDPYNAYLGPIYSILNRGGYSVIFHCTSELERNQAPAHVDDLIGSRVSAVLVQPATDDVDAKPFYQLQDAGIPLVVMDRVIEGLDAPQVVADQYHLGRKQTEHLLELGHRRIAHLHMPTSSYIGRERMRGYAEALADAGVPFDESLAIEVEPTVEAGEAAMAELLSLGKDRPTGVITRIDWVAAGALRAALRAGLSVPAELSIVGNTNAPLTELLTVPLTTFRHAANEIAQLAATHLLDLLSGRSVKPDIYLVKTSLVPRESCAPPPA